MGSPLSGKGVILEIKIKTGSGITLLQKKDGLFILNVQSEPENNKANAEIITYLGKLFGRNVKIVKGLRSRNKIIFIENITAEEIENLFQSNNLI